MEGENKMFSYLKNKLGQFYIRITNWHSNLNKEQRKINVDIAKALCIGSIIGGSMKVFNDGIPNNEWETIIWLLISAFWYIIAIKEAETNGEEK